jgi:hypothetical protein
MGGGGGPTSSTVTNTNIPDYAKPYVESMLGATLQQMFEIPTDPATGKPIPNEQGNYDITGFKPYYAYSQSPEDYVAEFSPLQQNAQANAEQLQVPTQFGAGSDIAYMAGMGALGAGQDYSRGVRNPYKIASYMNPYMQNVVDVQQQEAMRQADIAGTKRNAGFAQAGAFGGGRQAIENAEANRNLQTQLGNIQATGLSNAYEQAIKNQQFGASLGLQGYGQATNTAGQLGSLGQQTLGAQSGIIGLQSQLGGQQQQQQQNLINQAISNYATAQQYPQQQLAFLNAQLRGLPMQATTTASYQAPPSFVSQAAGLGTAGIAGLGLYNTMNK